MPRQSDDFARAGGYGGAHLMERLPRELLGMCRGLLMDGAVVDREIRELDLWCETNPASARTWPGNVLSERLRRILADGYVSEDERADLHLLLEEVTGYKKGAQRADDSIYTDPQPELAIIDEHFVLTGKFLFGPRKRVIETITLIGGHVASNVSNRTQHLIVGGRASAAWLEADMGGKIMDARELNRSSTRGPIIHIVREEHWSKYVLKPN